MIKAIFQFVNNDFSSKEITLPGVPSVGHQIFLGDFISTDEQDEIFKSNPSLNIDSLIVKHITWLKSPQNGGTYLLITLEV